MSLRPTGPAATFLLTAVMMCSVSQADTRRVVTTGSGDWSDEGMWRDLDDPSNTRPPDADDHAFVQAGHALTFSGVDETPVAGELNIYGHLQLQGSDATLATGAVYVRDGGFFELSGPQTLILSGGDLSFVAVLGGGRLRAEGRATSEGVVTAVVREDEGVLVLEDDTQAWTPGALRGARLKLLSGRSRLWSHTILDNTATTVTLDLGSRGAPSGAPPFEVEVGSPDSRVLSAPAETFRVDPRGYEGRQIAGRWLVALDSGSLHYVIGAQDNAALAGRDRLVVWPPLPHSDTGVSVSWTRGIESGDSYAITAPVTFTVPFEARLPTETPGRHHRIFIQDGATASLKHALVEYGSVDVRDIDGDEGEGVEIEDVEIAYADDNCMMSASRVRGVTLSGLHIRDVHPANDTLDHGGRWLPTDQRGHGLCYYGTEGIIRDNLLTSLNDDMIFVSGGSDILIEGNIAIASGIFHGNSDENITLYDLDGPVSVRRNVAMGADMSLLIDTWSSRTQVHVEDNLFIQSDQEVIVSERSGDPAAAISYTNNVLLSGRQGRVLFDGRGHPAQLLGNFTFDVTLWRIDEARENIILGTGLHPDPLIRDPGLMVSNLVSAWGLIPGQPLIRLETLDMHPELINNTLDAGAGDTVFFERPTSRGRFERNITMGRVTFNAYQRPPEGASEPHFAHNIAARGVIVSSRAWVLRHIDDTNTSGPLCWTDPARYTLPPTSPGAHQGFAHAGLPNPSALPLPLTGLPARRSNLTASDQCHDPEALDPISPDPSAPSTPSRPVYEVGPPGRPSPNACTTIFSTHHPSPTPTPLVALLALLWLMLYRQSP